MIRIAALIILLLFAGQIGIVDLPIGSIQKIESASETECDEEKEIQAPATRKHQKSLAKYKPVVRFSFPSTAKFPTRYSLHEVNFKTSRQITFCTFLI